MENFTNITAIAAPLPIQNVDTDMIIPKQFFENHQAYRAVRRAILRDAF